ncbi:helix-turn-helix domain-containing protein [Modestobacter sp. Leaf380]|uniref:helix-turn-helix domain-containing protein n=1 Tax=Modestobacter sp. Leaf380 TaxID=1736356 RepID=UPI0006FAE12F|nr:helix-turn-helix domain-containing protein [Modestobacter sp. Leaf380]KQS63554.1 transcriptional regulator [Modestobacter sp. Leaf380]
MADSNAADSTAADAAAELGKGKRITGDDRNTLADELRKRYDAGESIRLLAASTGRSYGFVHRLLSESGATLRSRGGANRSQAS